MAIATEFPFGLSKSINLAAVFHMALLARQAGMMAGEWKAGLSMVKGFGGFVFDQTGVAPAACVVTGAALGAKFFAESAVMGRLMTQQTGFSRQLGEVKDRFAVSDVACVTGCLAMLVG